MKAVKFTSNPYVKATQHQINVEMRDLVNTFVRSDSEDLLKKAEEILFPLGWSLEEFQDSNNSPHKRRKRRHNDKNYTGSFS